MAHIQKQKITPFLWFDNQAKEAANFYCSLFENSKIHSVSGMIVEFELEGIKFIGLNGGPKFRFNESVSFFISCKNQAEVDFFWNNFTSDGGEESMCGWCKDKYGLSWQVIPERFMEMMSKGKPDQVERVSNAMFKMRKMIIADLEEAYNQ